MTAETMPLHKWLDIAFGLAVMGTVGGLIGLPSISTKWDHPTRGPEMSPY